MRRVTQILSVVLACVAIVTAAIWVHSLFAHATLAFVCVDRQGAHPLARMRNLEWYSGKVCIYWVDATLLKPEVYEIYMGKEGQGWCANFASGPNDGADIDA